MIKKKPNSGPKIDPDLGVAVKTLLKSIREIKNLAFSDGNYLVVKDELLQPILDGRGWQNLYDGKEWKRLNEEINQALKEGIDEGLKPENLLDERMPRKRKALKRWLISKTRSFSPNSQAYYEKGITSFFNGTLLKPSWKYSGLRRQKAIEYNRKEIGAIFFALFCRLQFQALNEAIEFDEGLLNDPEILNGTMSLIYSIIAQITFEKTMYQLLKDENDDESILNAVMIDKAVVCSDSFRRRILRAELTGDTAFFRKLGEAISIAPVNNEGQHYESYIVLKIFWQAGICKLSNEEKYYFLKSCGIEPPPHPYGFEKFLTNHYSPRGTPIELP